MSSRSLEKNSYPRTADYSLARFVLGPIQVHEHTDSLKYRAESPFPDDILQQTKGGVTARVMARALHTKRCQFFLDVFLGGDYRSGSSDIYKLGKIIRLPRDSPVEPASVSVILHVKGHHLVSKASLDLPSPAQKFQATWICNIKIVMPDSIKEEDTVEAVLRDALVMIRAAAQRRLQRLDRAILLIEVEGDLAEQQARQLCLTVCI